MYKCNNIHKYNYGMCNMNITTHSTNNNHISNNNTNHTNNLNIHDDNSNSPRSPRSGHRQEQCGDPLRAPHDVGLRLGGCEVVLYYIR